MKLFILLVALMAGCAVGFRFKRQLFEDVDPKQVNTLMQNEPFVKSQFKCIMATDEEAVKLCDRIGTKIRKHLPAAIAKGDCPVKCTDDEKKAIVTMIDIMRTKYREEWNSVAQKLNITPEQETKLNTWVEQVKKLP